MNHVLHIVAALLVFQNLYDDIRAHKTRGPSPKEVQTTEKIC